MNNHRTADSGTLILSILAAVAMIAATAFLLPYQRPEGNLGICLPSPNLWPTLPLEWVWNMVALGACVLTAVLMNKKYGIIRSTDTSLPSALIIFIASDPLLTSYLGTPTIMLGVNLVCLYILMEAYGSSNATHQLFAVATFLSLGSMVQYAFIPFVFVYPVLALMCKAMRIKELLAYLMGLAAPFWIGFAFGLLRPEDFSLPQFSLELPSEVSSQDMLLMLLSLATLALLSLIMSVNNAMILYAGNTRVRVINNMINTIGFVCAVCMVFDFSNIAAYASTFCFTAAIQISNFFAIHRLPKSRLWFAAILLLFIAYFVIITII